MTDPRAVRLSTRSASCIELVAVAAAAVEARVDEVAADLADRVAAEIASVGRSPELSAAVLEAARGNVVLVTAMLRSWADVSHVPFPEGSEALVVELVRRGLAVDVLLRAYRVGQARYAEIISGELAASGAEVGVVLEAVQACSAFLFTWVDAATEPLIVRHAQEMQRRARSAQEQRLAAVREVLAGQVRTEDASVDLGYRLEGGHVALVVWPGERRRPITAEGVAERITAIPGLGAGSVLAVAPTSELVAVWLGGTGLQLGQLRHLGGVGPGRWSAAVGDPGVGVEGFRASHDQALRARRVALLLAPSQRLTFFADVAVADLLTRDVPAARAMAARTLGALAAGDDGTRRLLATLAVYHEEGHHVARTARRLAMSPNTVAYRIKRAAELSGAPDASSPALQAAVTLALLLGDDDVAPVGGIDEADLRWPWT